MTYIIIIIIIPQIAVFLHVLWHSSAGCGVMGLYRVFGVECLKPPNSVASKGWLSVRVLQIRLLGTGSPPQTLLRSARLRRMAGWTKHPRNTYPQSHSTGKATSLSKDTVYPSKLSRRGMEVLLMMQRLCRGSNWKACESVHSASGWHQRLPQSKGKRDFKCICGQGVKTSDWQAWRDHLAFRKSKKMRLFWLRRLGEQWFM